MLMACKLTFLFCEISLFGNSVIRCKACHNKLNSFSPLNNEVAIYLGLLDSSRDAKRRTINNIKPVTTFLYVPLINKEPKCYKFAFEKDNQ